MKDTNADARVRRTFSAEKPDRERVTCFQLTAELAKRAGELWARRGPDPVVRDAFRNLLDSPLSALYVEAVLQDERPYSAAWRRYRRWSRAGDVPVSVEFEN